MTTQTEALKSAIEFAEYCLEELDLSHMASNQAKRLVQKSKEALSSPNGEAQPEQEPVGQLLEDAFGRGQVMWFNKPEDESLLYTTPPQRKPLTDEEIGAILEGVNAYGTRLYTFARAIEAAHGIKE